MYNQFEADGKGVQSYGMARGWKIFLTIATPLLALLAGGLMLLPFLDGRTDKEWFVVFCALLGGVSLLFCLYALLSVYKSRIEIHPDRIKDVGLFKSSELQLGAISGFKIVQAQHVGTLQLWPNDPAAKKMSMTLTMERKDEFLAWVENNLADLDAIEGEHELKQLLDDTRLGETREQRQWVLGRARLWTNLANGSAYLFMIWAFFYPQPYRFLIGIALALPWIAVFLLWRFPRGITFNAKRNSALPDITPALLLPCLVLALRALLDFHLLTWENFWLPCASVSLLLYAALLVLVPPLRNKVGTAILLLVFTVIYGYGATIILNGMLDRSLCQTYSATVVDKSVSHGKHTSYYLKLSAWGPRTTEEDVDVRRADYARRKIGDRVPVVVRQGRFAIPWFYFAD